MRKDEIRVGATYRGGRVGHTMTVLEFPAWGMVRHTLPKGTSGVGVCTLAEFAAWATEEVTTPESEVRDA